MKTTNREFELYDEESAPPESRATLAETKRSFGMIPNLEAVMAGAPALLEGYGTLWDLAAKTSFSAAETQIVFQTVNVFHGCMSNYTNALARVPLDKVVENER